jgi:hypothetical protein
MSSLNLSKTPIVSLIMKMNEICLNYQQPFGSFVNEPSSSEFFTITNVLSKVSKYLYCKITESHILITCKKL